MRLGLAWHGAAGLGVATQDKVYHRRPDMGVEGFEAVRLGWTREGRARLGTTGRSKARSLLFMMTTGVDTMKGLAVIGAIIAGIIGIYTAMFA